MLDELAHLLEGLEQTIDIFHFDTGTGSNRDGRCIEEIGVYNPLTEPATINVDVEKAQTWIKNGAQPTDTVRGLLKNAGVL